MPTRRVPVLLVGRTAVAIAGTRIRSPLPHDHVHGAEPSMIRVESSPRRPVVGTLGRAATTAVHHLLLGSTASYPTSTTYKSNESDPSPASGFPAPCTVRFTIIKRFTPCIIQGGGVRVSENRNGGDPLQRQTVQFRKFLWHLL
eukprot:5096969-Prymnesium_polylepis.1